MTPKSRIALLGLALALGSVAGLQAQGTAPVRVTEAKKGLFKMAKVTAADAQKTAQAQYPTGTVKSGELEQSGGKLVYSFKVQQPSVTGAELVEVDAATGTVVKTMHEAPKPKTVAKLKPKKPATP